MESPLGKNNRGKLVRNSRCWLIRNTHRAFSRADFSAQQSRSEPSEMRRATSGPSLGASSSPAPTSAAGFRSTPIKNSSVAGVIKHKSSPALSDKKDEDSDFFSSFGVN